MQTTATNSAGFCLVSWSSNSGDLLGKEGFIKDKTTTFSCAQLIKISQDAINRSIDASKIIKKEIEMKFSFILTLLLILNHVEAFKQSVLMLLKVMKALKITDNWMSKIRRWL